MDGGVLLQWLLDQHQIRLWALALLHDEFCPLFYNSSACHAMVAPYRNYYGAVCLWGLDQLVKRVFSSQAQQHLPLNRRNGQEQSKKSSLLLIGVGVA